MRAIVALLLVVAGAGATCTPPAFGPGCALSADSDPVGFGVTVGCAAACGAGGACVDDACVCRAGYTLQGGTCEVAASACGDCGPQTLCGSDGVCYVGGAWPEASFANFTVDDAVAGTTVGAEGKTKSAAWVASLAVMGPALAAVALLGVAVFLTIVKI